MEHNTTRDALNSRHTDALADFVARTGGPTDAGLPTPDLAAQNPAPMIPAQMNEALGLPAGVEMTRTELRRAPSVERGPYNFEFGSDGREVNPMTGAFVDPKPDEVQFRGIDETSIEARLKAAGKTAARITPAHIDDQIVRQQFHHFPGTQVIVCVLELRNGFSVVGHSACASPANFDALIGQDLARKNAREQIWALEGYLLRSKIAWADQDAAIERGG